MARTNRQPPTWRDRITGADANRTGIAAGTAIAGTIRTTLGPNGTDKMLISETGTVVITNDGASILSRMDIDDPTARVVVNVADAQKQAVGDGTTTAILLTGELLAAADDLLSDGLHPTTILTGYQQAVVHARDRLKTYGIETERAGEDTMQAVARTAVTGKWDDRSADRFADLATRGVRAVKTDGRVNLQSLTVTAHPGGSLRESELVTGVLVDMDSSSTTIEGITVGFPRQFESARLALVDTALTIETADAIENVTLTTPDERTRLQEYIADTRGAVVRTLSDLGVDVLFCQKSIDSAIRTSLAKEGILSVERVRQDEFDALVRATEATAVQSITTLSRADIGRAGSIDRRSLGDTELLTITDCPGESHTSLLLRGGTEHVAEETQRIIEDCIAVAQLVLHDGRAVPGGGATEMALAQDLSARAETVSGREQLAIDAFADALEGVPRTLIENAGLDPIDGLAELRQHHYDGNSSIGIDPITGTPQNMLQSDVIEPRLVKDRCLTTALGATSMILRVDDIIPTTGSADDTEPGSDTHDHGSESGYPWALSH